MEGEKIEAARKRMKPDMEGEKEDDGGKLMPFGVEGNEISNAGSEEIELSVAQILEKIDHFTDLVCSLLDSGKAIIKELGDGFEEQLKLIHREHVEKWQEEIKELRLLDASNEEMNALLGNARSLLVNTHFDH